MLFVRFLALVAVHSPLMRRQHLHLHLRRLRLLVVATLQPLPLLLLLRCLFLRCFGRSFDQGVLSDAWLEVPAFAMTA